MVATASASPPAASLDASAAFSAVAEEDLALLAIFLAKLEVAALENNMINFAKACVELENLIFVRKDFGLDFHRSSRSGRIFIYVFIYLQY